MKAVVAAFNQEKALVGAFSVITNFRTELFEALVSTVSAVSGTVVLGQWSRGVSTRSFHDIATSRDIVTSYGDILL